MTTRQLWLQIPSQIATDLALDNRSYDGTWLKFRIDSQQGLTVVHNHFAEGKVDAGFARGRLRPVARQRRYEVTVRESRYQHYLAIDRLAALSASAAVNNQAGQLIVMRDWSVPDYTAFAAAVAVPNNAGNPFTDRQGFILQDSVKISASIQMCNPLDLRMIAPIQFSFVEANPSL